MDEDELQLDALRTVLRHRWDLTIIALLVESPRRRRDLTQQVRDERGEHIADGVLSDVLRRLVDQGLIKKSRPASNQAVYRATFLGHLLVRRVRDIGLLLPPADPAGPLPDIPPPPDGS